MCSFSSGVLNFLILQNAYKLHSAFSAIYIYEKSYGSIGIKNFLKKSEVQRDRFFV